MKTFVLVMLIGWWTGWGEALSVDIRALADPPQARQAKARLILAGETMLPELHRTLASSDTGTGLKSEVIDVLSAISHPTSVGPIIAAAQAQAALQGAALLALHHFAPTPAAFEFAARRLQTSQRPETQREALLYVAAHRDRRALEWVAAYATPDRGPEVRTAALFLAARLAAPGAEASIIKALQFEHDPQRQLRLLRGLAELVGPKELNAYAPQIPLSPHSRVWRNILQYAAFIHASGAEKVEWARRLLVARKYVYRRRAARYLIQGGHVDLLQRYLDGAATRPMPLHLRLLRSPKSLMIYVEARRLGLRLESSPQGLRLMRLSGAVTP